ncbi:hypothetical protein [Caudoviricetes sp.]|nr:hypothetical protein [Caudoviricetes sp.]
MMELKDRMLRTVAGQVTWADPELGKKCIDCKWCVRHTKPKLAPRMEDQCKLVFVHTKRHGVPFNAKLAIACSKFEG